MAQKNILNMELEFLSRVSNKDKAFMTRQISTMLESGLAIDKALKIFVNQTHNTKLKKIVSLILNDVKEGSPFSVALQKHPDVFDEVYINIIASGEAVGKLSSVLNKLADTLEKQNIFEDKIKSALYYPGFIVSVLLVIIYIMMTQVIPPLKDIFDEFDTGLPWTTRSLLTLSDFMVDYWWLILIFLILIIIIMIFYFKTENGKYVLSRMKLKFPLGIFSDIYMTRFCSTLSMLLVSGTPVIKALQITSKVINNVIFEKLLIDAASKMERGVPLSDIIEGDKEFNPLVPQMIRVGEETGRVDEVLDNLSLYFENEANNKLKNINSLIEPALIVMIGLGVAFIVFAVIMPIYQLVQLQ